MLPTKDSSRLPLSPDKRHVANTFMGTFQMLVRKTEWKIWLTDKHIRLDLVWGLISNLTPRLKHLYRINQFEYLRGSSGQVFQAKMLSDHAWLLTIIRTQFRTDLNPIHQIGWASAGLRCHVEAGDRGANNDTWESTDSTADLPPFSRRRNIT